MRSFDRIHIDIEALRARNPDLQEEILMSYNKFIFTSKNNSIKIFTEKNSA